MSCQWGAKDCKFEGKEQCQFCITDKLKYKQKDIKQPRKMRYHSNKADNRQGSEFEHNTQKTIAQHIKETEANMTLNSGATKQEKGDILIKGYLNVMIECKTQLPVRSRGINQFTIKREWLEKIARESEERDQDLWTLVFSFSEQEYQSYAIMDKEMFIEMITTMISDRKRADLASLQSKLDQQKVETKDKEISYLRSKIQELEIENDILKKSLSE